MHLQGGVRLPVVVRRDVLASRAGECVVLGGPVRHRQVVDPEDDLRQLPLRRAAASWSRDGGEVVDVAAAAPRAILALRRHAIGYVSQFLRAMPRVAALDIVAEPLRRGRRRARRGRARRAAATARPAQHARAAVAAAAGDLLRRRAAARQHRARLPRPSMPLLLLDEPTASLDADNRAAVVELIAEKKRARRRHRRHLPRRRRARRGRRPPSIDVTRFAAGGLTDGQTSRSSSPMPDWCSPTAVIERGWLAVDDGMIAEFGEGAPPERGRGPRRRPRDARPGRAAHRPSRSALHAAAEGALGPGGGGGVLRRAARDRRHHHGAQFAARLARGRRRGRRRRGRRCSPRRSPRRAARTCCATEPLPAPALRGADAAASSSEARALIDRARRAARLADGPHARPAPVPRRAEAARLLSRQDRPARPMPSSTSCSTSGASMRAATPPANYRALVGARPRPRHSAREPRRHDA